MVPIKKFSVGIRPAQKMFRVGSLYGSLVDSLLAARTNKNLGEDYFNEVGKNLEQGVARLSNERLGNFLHIDVENIVFTKDLYASEKSIDLEKILSEFHFLWKQVDEILQIRDIRRIGIAAEHQERAKDGHASATLIRALTGLPPPTHAAKFLLQLEDRRPPTNKVGVPDFKKDDFINVIRHYYDGELDIENHNADHINITLDVQRYFSPLLSTNIFEDVLTLYKKDFLKEKGILDADLKKRGLV